MRRLVDFIGRTPVDTKRPSVPHRLAVFALGDIHGQLDLMVDMHRQVIDQAKSLPGNIQKIIIYLGDYIDHGPGGEGVIDTLVAAPLPGFKSIYLLGDHELFFLDYLKGKLDDATAKTWLYERGGIETLRSYGVDIIDEQTPHYIAAMRNQLLRKIPTDHIGFLEQLQVNYALGDFFFVHAGIKPNKPLNKQNPMDMLTIGDDFIMDKTIHDKIIVHGHTEFPVPNIQCNRIGLDTQAYKSGILSGLMIQKDNIKMLQAKSNAC